MYGQVSSDISGLGYQTCLTLLWNESSAVALDQSVANVCPCCGAMDETTSHIVRCPSQGRTSLFHNSVSELVGWLKEVDTDPFLVVKPFCSVEASSLLSRFHMMLLMRMSWCLNKCVFLALITLSRVVYHQFWSTSNVNILYRLPP